MRGAFADLAWLVRSRQGRVLAAVAISFGISVATDAAIYLGVLFASLVVMGMINSLTGAIVVLVGWFVAYGAALAVGSAMTLTNAATVIMPAVDEVDPRITLVPTRPGVARWAAALSAALVSQVVVGIGFLLCLIPGLVAYLVFLTVPFERAIDQGVGVIDAMKRAARRFMSAPGAVILLVLASVGVCFALVAPGFLLSLIADAARPKGYDPYYGYSSPSGGTSLLELIAGLLVLTGLVIGIVLYQVLISLGVRRLLIAQAPSLEDASGAPSGWGAAPPPFGQAPSTEAGIAVPPAPTAPTPWGAPAPSAAPVPVASPVPTPPAAPAVVVPPPTAFVPATAPEPPAVAVSTAPGAGPAAWPAPGEEGDLFGGETVRRPGKSAGSGWQVTVPGAPASDLGRLTLIGRHPEPSGDDTSRYGAGAIRLVAVVDKERLVSKTHLALGVDADGVWAVDRGSTNGTVIVTASGRLHMTPGEVVRILEPTTFDIGDVLVTVAKTPA